MLHVDIKNTIKYFVFFLLLVYQSQGSLFASGAIVFKVVLAILMLIEAIYFVVCFNNIKKNVVNGFYLLVLLNVVYFLISDKHIYVSAYVINGLNDITTWTTLKGMMYPLLMFFVSYYFALNNKISEKEMRVFFYVFFAFAIFSYFTFAIKLKVDTGEDESVNNAVYGFVNLLPFIFLLKKKNIANIVLMVSLAFIMLSVKRGAIIIGMVFTLFYLYHKYIKNAGHNKGKNIMIFVILLFVMSFFVYNIYLGSNLLQYRMEATQEGDSSGRNIIYARLWSYWYNPTNNLLNYLFGFGFAASVKINGLFAHNDWLELLTMSGILGITIYVILFIQLIKCLRNNFMSVTDKTILLSILLIWFLKTIFSMGYLDGGAVPMFLLLGYVIGKKNYNGKICRVKYNNIYNVNNLYS